MTRDAARFRDTLNNLAQHVRTWHVYGAVNTTKAMKDTAEPVFTQPVLPQRKYYKFRTDQQISDQEPMVETSDRFTKGHLNTKLFDDTVLNYFLDRK